jgi:hypothetical protein
MRCGAHRHGQCRQPASPQCRSRDFSFRCSCYVDLITRTTKRNDHAGAVKVQQRTSGGAWRTRQGLAPRYRPPRVGCSPSPRTTSCLPTRPTSRTCVGRSGHERPPDPNPGKPHSSHPNRRYCSPRCKALGWRRGAKGLPKNGERTPPNGVNTSPNGVANWANGVNAVANGEGTGSGPGNITLLHLRSPGADRADARPGLAYVGSTSGPAPLSTRTITGASRAGSAASERG